MRFVLIALFSAAVTWQGSPLPFRLFTGETSFKPLPATMGGGLAVFDANGDGLLDLYFTNGAPLPSGSKTLAVHRDRLFLNQGDFRFADRTGASGLGGTGYNFAAATGDYDGDGRVDLFVTGLRGVALYRNIGDGKFHDVTVDSGINNHGRWAVGAAWFDYDRDGDLDLFLVNYVVWDAATEKTCIVDRLPDFCHPRLYSPQPNALFRNIGKGKFEDVSAYSGIQKHAGKGMAAAIADFDGDGFPDIFVTNDRVFNFYFRNLGDGRFEEDAFSRGIAAPLSGSPPSAMGADAQDFDGDGKPDLVYTALRDETFPLYRNTGTAFEEVTEKTKLGPLTRPMAGWSIQWADLDNDGWLDLAVARGDVLSSTGPRGASVKEPLSWLRNIGGRAFATGTPLPALPARYRGLVTADLDNDGCLDLITTALGSNAMVWKNSCANNWLEVDAPLGTRVKAGSQWRQYSSTTSGYASSCSCPLHFGVGTEKSVPVEVYWPDGSTKKLDNVQTNQRIRVTP